MIIKSIFVNIHRFPAHVSVNTVYYQAKLGSYHPYSEGKMSNIRAIILKFLLLICVNSFAYAEDEFPFMSLPSDIQKLILDKISQDPLQLLHLRLVSINLKNYVNDILSRDVYKSSHPYLNWEAEQRKVEVKGNVHTIPPFLPSVDPFHRPMSDANIAVAKTFKIYMRNLNAIILDPTLGDDEKISEIIALNNLFFYKSKLVSSLKKKIHGTNDQASTQERIAKIMPLFYTLFDGPTYVSSILDKNPLTFNRLLLESVPHHLDQKKFQNLWLMDSKYLYRNFIGQVCFYNGLYIEGEIDSLLEEKEITDLIDIFKNKIDSIDTDTDAGKKEFDRITQLGSFYVYSLYLYATFLYFEVNHLSISEPVLNIFQNAAVKFDDSDIKSILEPYQDYLISYKILQEYNFADSQEGTNVVPINPFTAIVCNVFSNGSELVIP